MEAFEEKVKRKKGQHTKASDTIKTVYPKSVDFLQELKEENQNRLADLGWDLPKTAHLGMPYFGAYPPSYEPSYSLLGLVRLPNKEMYSRSVVWNENFLEEAHDISVEESVKHEKLHITKDVEPRFRRAQPFKREHKLELDREIKKKSVSHVISKYGKRAEDILHTDTLRRYRKQGEGKTILGDVLTFWLRRYFEENYDKYKENMMKLKPKMNSERIQKSIKNKEAEIKNLYEQKFGFSIGG